MKSFPLRMILVGALLIGGAVSCREEGPTERAGRAVEEAAEDLREGSEDAAEEIREGVDDAAEETREAAERLGDRIEGER
jgi:hypothetical protein